LDKIARYSKDVWKHDLAGQIVCPISMMWDRVSALCYGSTGEFEVQLSQLSHIHELSMFRSFLISARIMQVVA